MQTPNEIRSVQSESGIIATLIKHPDYYFVADYLQPQHFSDIENGYLYYAIGVLAGKSVTQIDAYAIINALNLRESTKQWAKHFTQRNVEEVIELSGCLARDTIDDYQMLVDIVYDKALRRSMIEALANCERFCYNEELTDFSQKVYEEVDKIISQHHIYSTAVEPFSTKVDSMWSKLQEQQRNRGILGYASKIPLIAEYWSYEPEELILLCAPRKEGKSLFCMNELKNLLDNGARVLYIDSEMSDRQQYVRFLSHLSDISPLDIKRGNYDIDGEERIRAANEYLKTHPYYHCYETLLNKDRIYLLVKRLLNTTGLDMVIVDYIKSQGSTVSSEVYNLLGEYTDFLKNRIAGEFKLPVLAAAQLNRGGEIADSYKIEQFSSTINILRRKKPEEIQRDGRDCGNYKLFVKCNRNGSQMSDIDTEYIDLEYRGSDLSFNQAKKQHVVELPY